jgi:hypothetical protein
VRAGLSGQAAQKGQWIAHSPRAIKATAASQLAGRENFTRTRCLMNGFHFYYTFNKSIMLGSYEKMSI